MSKIWRAVTLQYLFLEASFLCKNDFVRWGLICASLPHVAQYVRNVVVDLGDAQRLLERASSVPTGFVGRTKVECDPQAVYIYTERLFPGLDCAFPNDSDFDVVLPIMSNATSLQWIMPPTQAGFDPATSHTARFLASFPNITHLSYFSHFLCPEVQVYFMSFFQNLRKCTFSLWGTNGLVYFFSGHGPQINLSQLEEIWIEECEPAGAMDWLLDNVLHNAPYPIRIRKLGWEFRDPPFSSDTFARLIGMVRGTLEELCFRPPWTPDG